MKIFALIIAVLIVVSAASLIFQNTKTPTHLGHKGGKLAPMPDKPNAVSSQTDIADKQVEPLALKESTQATIEAIVAALSAMGNNDIQVQESHYLYTIFTTPTMHYHDDVEFLIDESTQQLHFRSQSRAGYSDMGVNRQRYEQFRALYAQ